MQNFIFSLCKLGYASIIRQWSCKQEAKFLFLKSLLLDLSSLISYFWVQYLLCTQSLQFHEVRIGIRDSNLIVSLESPWITRESIAFRSFSSSSCIIFSFHGRLLALCLVWQHLWHVVLGVWGWEGSWVIFLIFPFRIFLGFLIRSIFSFIFSRIIVGGSFDEFFLFGWRGL